MTLRSSSDIAARVCKPDAGALPLGLAHRVIEKSQ
jgi:hypothetical protein